MQSRYSRQTENSKEKSSKSLAYGRQPATALMLDLGSGIPKEVIHNICNTLENLFSVACTMAGPCRIPFFSVTALTGFYESLLPMISVRGNFSRIQYCLRELQKMADSDQEGNVEDREGTISQALIEVCRQFQHFKQGSFQLEILFLTNKNSEKLNQIVRLIEQTVNVEHLKRIQVVGLYYSMEMWMGELSSISSQFSHSGSSLCTSIETSVVEMITIESDLLSLQNYFGTLLKDGGTDNEHLHLILPPSSDDTPLIIKCDLLENLINPSHIPFKEQYLLHTEGANGKLLLPPGSKLSGVALPLLKVHIKQVLSVSALCESLIFGMPYIIEPTSSWKIDWDELEGNRASFQALCHLLLQKECVLIGQLEQDDNSLATSHPRKVSDKYLEKIKQPLGYFVLLPAQNGKLLIKSLACKELMLPHNQGIQMETPSAESLESVETSISQLECVDVYNPLLISSGLYGALKQFVSQSSHYGPQKRAAKIPVTGATKAKHSPLFQSSKEPVFDKRPSTKYKHQCNPPMANSSLTDFVDASDFYSEFH